MKKRALTEMQLTVLNMKLNKHTNNEIASVLGIHPDTVSNKWTAIQLGIKKDAYNNVPGHVSFNMDLFESLNNE